MNAHARVAEPPTGAAPLGHRLDNFELQGAAVQRSNGVVYRGWDHNLGIPVAIREYLPLHLAWRKPDGDVEPLDASVIDAFERGRHAFVNEARVLARCDHPSLLRVRQLLHLHGTSYRVMPWYDGRPLLELRREIAQPPDEAALRALLTDLLGALETYHRVGGVHGGVNPSQILLLDDDRALLLGPGAARRDTETDTDTGEALIQEGGFLAPEQLAPFDEAPTGPWTDFFALARVLRFCISGMLPPAPGEPAPEPAASTVEKLYFDAPAVHYSENFLAALDAAASLDIDERPQTAAEFRDWLDHGPRRMEAVSAPAPFQALPTPAPARPPVRAAEPLISGMPAPSAAASSTPAPSTPAPIMPAPIAPAPMAPAPITPMSGAPATASRTPGKRVEEEPDAETIALIQRVIESIPDRIDAPQRIELPPRIELLQRTARPEPRKSPERPEPLVPPEPPEPPASESSWQADQLHHVPPTALTRAGAVPGMWLLVAALLLSLGGYAIWALQSPATPIAEQTVASTTTSVNPAPASVDEGKATVPPAAPSGAGAVAPSVAPSITPLAASSADASAAQATATGKASAAAAPTATPGPIAADPGPGQQTTAAKTPRLPAASRVAEQAALPAAPTGPESPRAACGPRKEFSLYRCMQQQCAMAAWTRHPQCVRLKATDQVD